MSWLQVTAGVALLITVVVDLVWTALAAGSGAGPLTGRLGRFSWSLALRLHRRRRSHRVLSASGVLVALALLMVWILITFSGWALILNASTGAVRHAQTGQPADLVERLYYIGYTIFTLGNGEFRPGSGVWQLAAVLATSSGLVLVTMAITYLVPVASAVAQRRQLAAYVHSLGPDAHTILVRAWNGSDFGTLSQHLSSLVPMLHSVGQQHLAYPVLHYFHAVDPQSAVAPNLVHLDEAVELLHHGVDPDVRPDPGLLRVVDETLDELLGTMSARRPDVLEQRPNLGLEPLRAAGIPTVDESQWRHGSAGRSERSERRAAALADDGWTREEVG